MNRIRSGLAAAAGKITYRLLRLIGRQGSTLPGVVSLKLDPGFLAAGARDRRIICVTGTNGKTTTTSVLTSLLAALAPDSKPPASNAFGANMDSGLASTLLRTRRGDTVVLEVDEAFFARTAASLQPAAVIVTNLFSDQLDRFGDIDTVYELIDEGIRSCPEDTQLILCGDDPRVAFLGGEASPRRFFSAGDSELSVAEGRAVLDGRSTCRHCGRALDYQGTTIGHLGRWSCPGCGSARPEPDLSFARTRAGLDYHVSAAAAGDRPRAFSSSQPLAGIYNAYNIAAALLCAAVLVPDAGWAELVRGLDTVEPAFGRLERISWQGRTLCFVLVKNPAGLEQGVRLVGEADDAGAIVFAINNRVNDGRDVSWIWSAPLEDYELPDIPIGVTGEKREEMLARLDRAYHNGDSIDMREDGTRLVLDLLEAMPEGRTLYLLPNYSAMMDLRSALAEPLGYSKVWEPGSVQS